MSSYISNNKTKQKTISSKISKSNVSKKLIVSVPNPGKGGDFDDDQTQSDFIPYGFSKEPAKRPGHGFSEWQLCLNLNKIKQQYFQTKLPLKSHLP